MYAIQPWSCNPIAGGSSVKWSRGDWTNLGSGIRYFVWVPTKFPSSYHVSGAIGATGSNSPLGKEIVGSGIQKCRGMCSQRAIGAL